MAFSFLDGKRFQDIIFEEEQEIAEHDSVCMRNRKRVAEEWIFRHKDQCDSLERLGGDKVVRAKGWERFFWVWEHRSNAVLLAASSNYSYIPSKAANPCVESPWQIFAFGSIHLHHSFLGSSKHLDLQGRLYNPTTRTQTRSKTAQATVLCLLQRKMISLSQQH